MMPEQSHGQLMDAVYRHQRFIYDITRKYYLLGRDRLIADLAPPPGGHVLEIACGTGRNLSLIGRRYPDVALYGLDISSQMLVTARGTLDRAGVAGRTRLAEADACAFDAAAVFGRAQFDRVVLSYSLSMIPDWQAALERAAQAVAPGGRLAVVDFGDQGRLPGWFRAGLRAWLAKFHVSPRAGLPEAMAAIGRDLGAAAEVAPLYRDYAILGTLTRPG